VTISMTSAPAEVFDRVIQEGFNEGKLGSLSEIVAPDLIENQAGASPGLERLSQACAVPFPTCAWRSKRLSPRAMSSGPGSGRAAPTRGHCEEGRQAVARWTSP